LHLLPKTHKPRAKNVAHTLNLVQNKIPPPGSSCNNSLCNLFLSTLLCGRRVPTLKGYGISGQVLDLVIYFILLVMSSCIVHTPSLSCSLDFRSEQTIFKMVQKRSTDLPDHRPCRFALGSELKSKLQLRLGVYSNYAQFLYYRIWTFIDKILFVFIYALKYIFYNSAISFTMYL